MKIGIITCFCDYLEHFPPCELVSTYTEWLQDVQVNQAHHQLDRDVYGNTLRYAAADLLHSCDKIKNFLLNPEGLRSTSQTPHPLQAMLRN